MKQNVPLAPLTTFGLGGSADHLLEITESAQLSNLPHRDEWRLLGGGSNLLIHDTSLPGLTIANRIEGTATLEHDDAVYLSVGAGMVWDDIVSMACKKNWQGIECLSGIPGTVGAAPVQNIGAYGQNIADTIHEVSALDLTSGEHRIFTKDECLLNYRSSIFQSGDFLVTSVTLRLQPNRAPTLSYQDLAGRFTIPHPPLSAVRNAILDIRASKGALAMEGFPRLRSAGSFFKNPIITNDALESLHDKLARPDERKWYWTQTDGTVKIAAGRLIEAAGFPRGFRDGDVGNSPYHSLSLVAYPGATAQNIVDLARRIQEAVLKRFAITLAVEPQLWGWNIYPLLKSDSVLEHQS